ncbi:MAG: hypothetical protein MI724_03335 [Spirochaetales bacterium]|nr:hypothetical protein [Spirochaetales bacterium]
MTIHTLLTTRSPTLDAPSAWHTARVTKALYKGISYLIRSEDSVENGNALSDVDELITDIKGMIAAYIADRLGLPLHHGA